VQRDVGAVNHEVVRIAGLVEVDGMLLRPLLTRRPERALWVGTAARIGDI
jgi:hypothetical protein